jgi:tetratricopeptide (TPR) repeat protein
MGDALNTQGADDRGPTSEDTITTSNEIARLRDAVDQGIQTGIELANLGRLDSAIAAYDSARVAARRLYTYAQRARDAASESDERLVADALANTLQLSFYAEANANLAVGQILSVQGDPGAAQRFIDVTKAIDGLQRLERLQNLPADPVWQVMHDAAQAFASSAEATLRLMRLDYASATAGFHRAAVALNVLAVETLPRLAPESGDDTLVLTFGDTFRSAELVARNMMHYTAARLEAERGAWEEALSEYDRLVEIAEVLDQAHRATDDMPSWIVSPVAVGRHVAQAQRALVRAEVLKSEGSWDGARAAYKQARIHFRDGATESVRQGGEHAAEVQETLLNQASMPIDLAIRQSDTERALRERLDRAESELRQLRASLIDVLEHSGVTVNSNAEIVATIEQSSQIVTKVELAARDLIAQVIEALEADGMSTLGGEELVARGRQLADSDEEGTPFLERVRKYAEDLAAIVEKSTIIAGPLVSLAKALLTIVR